MRDEKEGGMACERMVSVLIVLRAWGRLVRAAPSVAGMSCVHTYAGKHFGMHMHADRDQNKHVSPPTPAETRRTAELNEAAAVHIHTHQRKQAFKSQNRLTEGRV